MCGGLEADPKDNKVGKLILPSRSSQGNEGDQQHFHCDLESSRALLCCSLRIEGSLPPRLPATLHDLPGEARSPRPSITRGCPKKPGQHCIPRAQPLPSGEMCPRWGSCLCGGWWWWTAQGKHFSSPSGTRVHSRSGARFWLGCLLFSVCLAVVTFSPFLTNEPISQPEWLMTTLGRLD